MMTAPTLRRRHAVASAALSVMFSLTMVLPGAGAQGPGRVSDDARTLLTELGFKNDQIEQAATGTAVALVIHDSGDESAQAGAVWVDAPAERFLEAYADVETMQQGDAVEAIKKMSQSPVAGDFASLSFPAKDLGDLHSCKVGDCAIKIDAAGLQQLGTIDWSASDASAKADGVLRRILFGYVGAYLREGNAGLPLLVDKKDPVSTADELDALIAESTYLQKHAQEVAGYLRGYPADRPAGISDFFYWELANIGLKPLVVVDHVLMRPAQASGDPAIIAVVQLYASHYFHAALQLMLLMPAAGDDGTGFLLVSINRSRSDGLTGFSGHFVRHVGEGRAKKSLEGSLDTLKRRTESR